MYRLDSGWLPRFALYGFSTSGINALIEDATGVDVAGVAGEIGRTVAGTPVPDNEPKNSLGLMDAVVLTDIMEKSTELGNVGMLNANFANLNNLSDDEIWFMARMDNQQNEIAERDRAHSQND